MYTLSFLYVYVHLYDGVAHKSMLYAHQLAKSFSKSGSDCCDMVGGIQAFDTTKSAFYTEPKPGDASDNLKGISSMYGHMSSRYLDN